MARCNFGSRACTICRQFGDGEVLRTAQASIFLLPRSPRSAVSFLPSNVIAELHRLGQLATESLALGE